MLCAGGKLAMYITDGSANSFLNTCSGDSCSTALSREEENVMVHIQEQIGVDMFLVGQFPCQLYAFGSFQSFSILAPTVHTFLAARKYCCGHPN
eukprot:3815671-Amphidinium_carterae.1